MEEEEEHNSKQLKTSTSQPPVYPPWLDLPNLITELVLENLPLPDYLRFASVCRKWLSIQDDHRRRHHPSQPPMSPTLPWLIPDSLDRDSRLHCYCPFDQPFYRLQRIHPPSGGCTFYSHGWIACTFSSHGWIFHYYSDADYERQYSLVNPLTAATIELPEPFFLSDEFVFEGYGAMSGPPTDPDCTILLIDADVAYLIRVNDDLYANDEDGDCWTRLHLQSLLNLPKYSIVVSTTVFSGGKFYCISGGLRFYVVDPVLPKPLVRFIDLDSGQIPSNQLSHYLVEFDGEVLIAVSLFDPRHLDDPSLPDEEFVLGFQVFRPDYSEKMWVRVDSLGDRALFVHRYGCFSLSASDVGCKKNCIYQPKTLLTTELIKTFAAAGDFFEVFDLETGRWIDERPHYTAAVKVDFSQCTYEDMFWFMPRLDSVS